MSQNYIQWNLEKIVPGESIPAALYLQLEGRYVLYRVAGQVIDRNTFDRMEIKKVLHFFVLDTDRDKFKSWFETINQTPASPSIQSGGSASSIALKKTREEAKRKIADIFHSFHAEESITQVLETSSSLVEELTKSPLASQPLAELQSLSRGTADHSVNVSTLSVYLALNMGYSHMVILKHLAAGALLHDIGKIEALKMGETSPELYEEKLKLHPALGDEMLAKLGEASREARIIVMQHHECHDGSGYPAGLTGNKIYDLAKIVSMANVFDELVADGKGPLGDRQKHALAQLEGPLSAKFHPTKLKKVIKILSLGV